MNQQTPSTASGLIVQPTRLFKMNKQTLPDPNPDMTPDEVKDMYAASYPALAAFTVVGPNVEKENLVYEFQAPPVKTKGQG